MAQPTPYNPTTDFSDDELANTGGRSTVRTAALDAELANIATTISQALANLSLNQRDDGEIRDERVKMHTLAADVKALLGAGQGVPRGAWLTATAYALRDIVTQGSNSYICAVAHTSGTFATDLAAVKWLLLALGAAPAASGVPFVATGTIAATNVQAAIEEADTEGRALSAAAAAQVTALTSDLANAASASKGAGQVGFSYAPNYAVGTIGAVVQSLGIDVSQPPFNCDLTGVADCSAAVNLALTTYPGVPIQLPAGDLSFYSTLSITPTASWGVFGPAAIIMGAGVGRTFLHTYVANGPLFDIDSASHGGSYSANMGTILGRFNIVKGGSTAGTIGIRVLNGYQVDIEQIVAKSLSIGIELRNGAYPDDGWNRVRIRQSWLDGCTRWGIKADGGPGRNEGSFTILENVFFQSCGTAETPCAWTATISGVTMTVSAVASGSLVIGRRIVAAGVDGDTVIEQQLSGSAGGTGTYRLSIDGAATSQTVASATAMHDAPNSGAMIWKGQILTIDSSGCANGTQNVGLYIKGGAGLANNVDIRGWVSENTVGRGIYCTGVTNLRMRNFQVYNNDTYKGTTQVEFEAANYVVRQVDIDGVVIRATSGNNPITAFKLSGANADLRSCLVRNVSWDNFDYTGQTRFDGWQFEPVERQCEMEVTSGFVRYRAGQTAGRGRSSPMRLRTGLGGNSTSGEWVAYQPPTAGVVKLTGTLTAGTVYYVYLYDTGNGSTTLDFSTTAPALDTASGYMVKSTDAGLYYIGAVKTDGAGTAFLTTAVGWLNPEVIYAGGTATGTPYYRWADSSGRLRIKTTAPTSDGDGTIVGLQS